MLPLRARIPLTTAHVSYLTFTMSHLAATLIDDRVLLIVTLIDAVLLAFLLLIAIKNSTAAATSFIAATFVFAILVFLFFHDQIWTAVEPSFAELRSQRRRFR